MAQVITGKKFELGEVVVTRLALEAAEKATVFGGVLPMLLRRHARGDWGDIEPVDVLANENALDPKRPERLMSVYTLRTGRKVWVVTEADRSRTTVLLPEEY